MVQEGAEGHEGAVLDDSIASARDLSALTLRVTCLDGIDCSHDRTGSRPNPGSRLLSDCTRCVQLQC